MLYIISEIKISLFIDTQVCPWTCAFLTPSDENDQNNITPCCFGYKMNEEKRKTENSTDQKVSVFPESRELLTCFEGYWPPLASSQPRLTAISELLKRFLKKETTATAKGGL